MKLKYLLIIGLIITSIKLDAQNLRLTDLHNISSVKNWESANQYLLNKGWEYYESSKGDSKNYNVITWSYKRNYNDEAQGWFYVYTTDSEPNKISYTTFNKSSYSAVLRELNSNNYKLLDSEIDDNEITSEYSNQHYILRISTDKREGSSSFDETVTGYRFTLIEKFGTFDVDNGKKVEYHDNGNISIRYNLKNGKIDGKIEVYHPSGQLKKTGTYLNGKQNGLFKEYDEEGDLVLEYNVKNNLKHGSYIEYIDGKKSYQYNYDNGELSGAYINYIYTDEGKLVAEQHGNFANNEKVGIWKTIPSSNRENVIFQTTYKDGMKNGYFHEPLGDSLVVGNYKNDELHGKYKIFLDVTRMLGGGIINTDTTELQVLTEGHYFKGDKSGKWLHYDVTQTLREEGIYENGLKQGPWKYYYSNISIENKPAPYAKKLYLIENYNNGKQDGLQQRFSYLNKEEKPCAENSDKTDDCWDFVFYKVKEISNYKDGVLHGHFSQELENLDFILKGEYKSGEKEGEWIEKNRYIIDSKPVYLTKIGEYIDGEKNGVWKEYLGDDLVKEINYNKGDLNGDYIVRDEGRLKEKRIFDYGELDQFIVYDSTGVNVVEKYEYIRTSSKGPLWKRSNPMGSITMTQEYRVKPDSDINSTEFEFILRDGLNSKTNQYNAYRDGKFEMLENNTPQIVGYFDKDLQTGKWTFFFYDQGVKIQSDFINGEKQNEIYLTLRDEPFDGTFVYFDSEENIKEERRVRDGLRDGNTKYIDLTTDKTIRKEKYKEGEIK
ncbi:hypothetical protein NE848_09925 [Gramella jeungdoensis]|uniref:Toxin-antitoxin system YwqK family antitoxin n=1 Tax=Gramella jeungdoensis TaxID=708091 RepID=A0ABT0Z2R2_9FLAO|nr:hypothetical protein [Gramella jeungdoensis]MCM8569698.1 hypothetical protein [Gramella jeungdoensis]